MESFPLFFKIRAVTCGVIMLFSFLWLVLLSVESFTRWSMSDQISHSLMILFILTNTTTLILLPVLILVKFRVWLDAARLFLLFVLQAGSAAAGTYWSPRIQCPDRTPDDIGVCQLIGIYSMIACWIIPAILVFYSTYFAIVAYLQSRIPVVVEPDPRSGIDSEKGLADTLASWKEMIKAVGVRRSSTGTGSQPRQLVLPAMVQTGQSSLQQSLAPQSRSTLPNPPRRQSTIPSLPHTGQRYFPAPHSAPSRHRSLPAFKHGHGPHVPSLLTMPKPDPLAINTPPSYPQTPSSHSYSTRSSANPHSQLFNFGPSVADAQSSGDHRWRSKRLSMMSSSSSPREMPSGETSPTSPRSTRVKLTKPVPAHYM